MTLEQLRVFVVVAEHEHVTQAARDHGVGKSSEAERTLQEWLRTKPPDLLLDGALQAISAVLGQWTSAERERYARNLLERCSAVAAASGGVFGFGRISSRERDVLDRIRWALEPHPQPTPTSTR